MIDINKELLENLTVLYVEDDEMTQEEVTFFLSRYIKNFIVAKNGQEGYELYLKHKPDLIITDIQMPLMNGLEMSKKILDINPSVPIIITTAYSDAQYLVQAIELGIDKYILKPINLSDLLILIQKSLDLICQNSKYYEEYIQFILDASNSFMFILSSQKIEYVNKNLSKLMGEESLKLINQKFEVCKNLFHLEDVETNLNYIDYIIQNPNKNYLVSLNSNECEAFKDKKFYVKYKYFEDMKKSIFIFKELEDEKLEHIKRVLDIMLEGNDNKKESDFIENLIKIIKSA